MQTQNLIFILYTDIVCLVYLHLFNDLSDVDKEGKKLRL